MDALAMAICYGLSGGVLPFWIVLELALLLVKNISNSLLKFRFKLFHSSRCELVSYVTR
jgi:hypothetical protein